MEFNPSPDQQLRQPQDAGERTRCSSTEPEAAHLLEQTVRELRVRRIELEMQNRALQETQSELEFALRRYADLYDHLPIGYVTLTPKGEIVEANLTAASWLGVDRPALCGVFLKRFLNPFDAGRLAAHLEACLVPGVERTFEATLRVNSGAMMAVQFWSRSAPVQQGEPPRVLAAITQLGQLKQTQQLMAEIRREQDALGDSISHDLRSPLVTIGTYAKIVLNDYGSTLNPEVRNMVERMERASDRMAATLRQLLAYSLIVREAAELEHVETESLVLGVLSEFKEQIETSGATVGVVPPFPAVMACPRLLSPALANLISNALKFTKPGDCAHVTISAQKRGEFVVLCVADCGIGIEPQYHERIFGVFDRLHGYSAYPGAGVGLAIVRRAMERMHGRAWVESEKDRGCRFYLMVPGA